MKTSRVGKEFFVITTKAILIKEHFDRLDFIKTKKFCSRKTMSRE